MNEISPIMAAPVARDAVPAVSTDTEGAEQSIFLEPFLPFADDAAE